MFCTTAQAVGELGALRPRPGWPWPLGSPVAEIASAVTRAGHTGTSARPDSAVERGVDLQGAARWRSSTTPVSFRWSADASHDRAVRSPRRRYSAASMLPAVHRGCGGCGKEQGVVTHLALCPGSTVNRLPVQEDLAEPSRRPGKRTRCRESQGRRSRMSASAQGHHTPHRGAAIDRSVRYWPRPVPGLGRMQ